VKLDGLEFSQVKLDDEGLRGLGIKDKSMESQVVNLSAWEGLVQTNKQDASAQSSASVHKAELQGLGLQGLGAYWTPRSSPPKPWHVTCTYRKNICTGSFAGINTGLVCRVCLYRAHVQPWPALHTCN